MARTYTCAKPEPKSHRTQHAVSRLAGALVWWFAACWQSDRASTPANQQAAMAKPPVTTPDPNDSNVASSFAQPNPIPPAPPDGAALLDGKPFLYAQRCNRTHPCATLTGPKGEAHCRSLRLGSLDGWRLPTRDEAKRFSSQLDDVKGFHWTSTRFVDDVAQAWIVDPNTGHETTIPLDRKPFAIRCVREP